MAAALPLLGCVTDHDASVAKAKQALDSYIGQPVSNVAINLGPPNGSFDVGNGQRAFQWLRTGSYQTGGSAMPIGRMVVFEPSQTVQTSCRISFIATSPKGGQQLSDWIVTTWRYVGNGCI
jgi:hypothetical protein